MLIELRIRDYAVIHDLSLRLEPGLNVFSGETGAGKSIIVGALSLLLGERASSQVVRKGADRAVVEAAFDVAGMEDLETRLAELGFPAEDGVVVLRREVAAEGRNRAWVNGSPATASVLGEVGGRLVDIHGQHEHQSLLRVPEQRWILDVFGEADGLARETRSLNHELALKRRELEEKGARIRELETRADFLRFQLGEIDAAALQVGEEDLLHEEARRLEHAEELSLGARKLHERLYSGDDSVSDRVSSLQSLLERLVRVDSSLEAPLKSLEEAYHLLADTGQRLGSYASGLDHDPGRLEEIRRRQDLLFRLKRKYGPEVEDVLELGARVRAELQELGGASFDLEDLQGELRALEDLLLARVRALSARREDAARRLEKEVRKILPDLGLGKGEFRVALTPLPSPGPGGGEQVEFLVSLNPGFDPGPLSRIASGGELSRVMLALKAILAGVDRVPTLVFDEIDSGIGGEVAVQVAGKLRDVARHHQVFVITHLPQLASRAQHQLLVEKVELKGLASTRVRELTGEERVREVARMLGGDPDSATSRDHARELLGVG
jgi:DNA repair protein RecN (Recombination protein N)